MTNVTKTKNWQKKRPKQPKMTINGKNLQKLTKNDKQWQKMTKNDHNWQKWQKHRGQTTVLEETADKCFGYRDLSLVNTFCWFL